MKRTITFGLTALLLFVASTSESVAVDFARDIKPLFNKHCKACHGGVKHSGNLSLVYHS